MPELNGIEATRQIVEKQPKVGILVVTMFDDDESVFAVMRAGARGYLLKDADQEELVRAITAPKPRRSRDNRKSVITFCNREFDLHSCNRSYPSTTS